MQKKKENFYINKRANVIFLCLNVIKSHIMLLIVIKCYYDKKMIFPFKKNILQYVPVKGDSMKRELSNKIILEDFTNKTILNDIEKDVLIRYIKNESIIQISEAVVQSTSSVSRIIARLKNKYNDYKKIELSKLLVLK